MTTHSRPEQPLYQQVYKTILARIVDGDLPAGSMLPSEFDIAAEMGVSQGTARKALIQLEQEGVLERRQGKGTFVAVTTPERALFHFFRLRDADGAQVMPELIQEDVRRLKSNARDRLHFGEATESIYEIRRLRGVGGAPGMREISRVPAQIFPGLGERAPLPNTLYAMYQKSFGIAVVRADEEIRAVAADDGDCAALGIDPGTPLLEVARRAVDLSGGVVELRSSRYLTASLHYAVTLS